MQNRSSKPKNDNKQEDEDKSKDKPTRFEPSGIAIYSLCLIACRIISALVQPISDCDEVFNYWEPTHLLLHHADSPASTSSFQTWEYAPQFALRSYFYVIIHAAIAKFWMLVLPFLPLLVNKVSFIAYCCVLKCHLQGCNFLCS